MQLSLPGVAGIIGVDPATLSYSATTPTKNQELLAVYLLNMLSACQVAGYSIYDGIATTDDVSEAATYISSLVSGISTWLESAIPVGVAADLPVPVPPSTPDVSSGKGIALIIAQILAKGGAEMLVKWVSAKLSRRQGDTDELVTKLEEIKSVLESANDLSSLKEITIDLNDEAGGRIRVYPFAYAVEKTA